MKKVKEKDVLLPIDFVLEGIDSYIDNPTHETAAHLRAVVDFLIYYTLTKSKEQL